MRYPLCSFAARTWLRAALVACSARALPAAAPRLPTTCQQLQACTVSLAQPCLCFLW